MFFYHLFKYFTYVDIELPCGSFKVRRMFRYDMNVMTRIVSKEFFSGGNVDVNMLNRIINRGLAKKGRVCTLELELQDKPGTLSAVLKVVADQGGNILAVNHERVGATAEINSCLLHLELETLNPDHIARIRQALTDAGFRLLS